MPFPIWRHFAHALWVWRKTAPGRAPIPRKTSPWLPEFGYACSGIFRGVSRWGRGREVRGAEREAAAGSGGAASVAVSEERGPLSGPGSEGAPRPAEPEPKSPNPGPALRGDGAGAAPPVCPAKRWERLLHRALGRPFITPARGRHKNKMVGKITQTASSRHVGVSQGRCVTAVESSL